MDYSFFASALVALQWLVVFEVTHGTSAMCHVAQFLHRREMRHDYPLTQAMITVNLSANQSSKYRNVADTKRDGQYEMTFMLT